MYRIYDTPSAIREVQRYLSLTADEAIFVAPSGVYDENTRKSVIDFQKREGLLPTGVVDRETFELLYLKYSLEREKNLVREGVNQYARLPLRPGESSVAMIAVNAMLARLLSYYDISHNFRRSGYYSAETSRAVQELKKIYRLDMIDEIDEIFYGRMSNDLDLINMLDYNFG